MGNKLICKKKVKNLKEIENYIKLEEKLTFEITLSNFMGENLPSTKNGLFLEIKFGKKKHFLTKIIKFQNNPIVK